MTVKVLGFKEKDSYRSKQGIINIYHVKPDKLVPVVSVEWLRKEIEKHNCSDYHIPRRIKTSNEQLAFIDGVVFEFEAFKRFLLSAVCARVREAKKE